MQGPISIGDLLQQVSAKAFNDLHTLTQNIGALTPEVRCVRLRQYLSHQKKILSILLSLCKWIGFPQVQRFLGNVSNLDSNLTVFENQLNEIQDGLYFTHMNLFSRRRRTLDLQVARDVLTTGQFRYLPMSIFTCGKVPDPIEADTFRLTEKEKADILLKDVKMLIAAKILLEPAKDKEGVAIVIDTNCAIFTMPKLFETKLTLQYLCHTAPWEPIGFRIFVNDVDVEHGGRGFDVSAVEAKVLAVLKQHSQGSAILEHALSSEARTVKAGMIIEGVPTVERTETAGDMRMKPVTPHDFTLGFILSICRRASQAVALRVLLAQALRLAKSPLLLDFVEVSFKEILEKGPELSLRFWKTEVTREYLLEVTVSMQKYGKMEAEGSHADDSHDLSMRIAQCLLSKEEVGHKPHNDEVLITPKENLNKHFDILRYITSDDQQHEECGVGEGGKREHSSTPAVVGAAALLQDVVRYVSRAKLRLLYARILVTPEVLMSCATGVSSALLISERDEDYVELRCILNRGQDTDVFPSTRVMVDARSGSFFLHGEHFDMSDAMNDFKSSFLAEINSVFTDQLFAAYIREYVEGASYCYRSASSSSSSSQKAQHAPSVAQEIDLIISHFSVGDGTGLVRNKTAFDSDSPDVSTLSHGFLHIKRLYKAGDLLRHLIVSSLVEPISIHFGHDVEPLSRHIAARISAAAADGHANHKSADIRARIADFVGLAFNIVSWKSPKALSENSHNVFRSRFPDSFQVENVVEHAIWSFYVGDVAITPIERRRQDFTAVNQSNRLKSNPVVSSGISTSEGDMHLCVLLEITDSLTVQWHASIFATGEDRDMGERGEDINEVDTGVNILRWQPLHGTSRLGDVLTQARMWRSSVLESPADFEELFGGDRDDNMCLWCSSVAFVVLSRESRRGVIRVDFFIEESQPKSAARKKAKTTSYRESSYSAASVKTVVDRSTPAVTGSFAPIKASAYIENAENNVRLGSVLLSVHRMFPQYISNKSPQLSHAVVVGSFRGDNIQVHDELSLEFNALTSFLLQRVFLACANIADVPMSLSRALMWSRPLVDFTYFAYQHRKKKKYNSTTSITSQGVLDTHLQTEGQLQQTGAKRRRSASDTEEVGAGGAEENVKQEAAPSYCFRAIHVTTNTQPSPAPSPVSSINPTLPLINSTTDHKLFPISLLFSLESLDNNMGLAGIEAFLDVSVAAKITPGSQSTLMGASKFQLVFCEAGDSETDGKWSERIDASALQSPAMFEKLVNRIVDSIKLARAVAK